MREFVSPPLNHVWEINLKIQLIQLNLNTLDINQKSNELKIQQLIINKVDKSTTINNYPLNSNILLTKADIGLGNVNNTADIDKPISKAVQEVLDDKASHSEVNVKINQKFADYFQNIPLKLRQVEDHKYEFYIDADKNQILELKNNPGSSIMSIPIDLSLNNYSNSMISFSKYSYIDNGILLQNIHIDYDISPDIILNANIWYRLNANIWCYRPNYIFNIDISDYNYTFNPDENLFNLATLLKYFIQPKILLFFNIDDKQASITNLTITDITNEGTYIIKTGSTLHTIYGLEANIKFPEGKAPTFEVNKTYILKVTYDAKSTNYYCTDIKSYNNI